jgi:hypothetical protein
MPPDTIAQPKRNGTFSSTSRSTSFILAWLNFGR